MFLGHYALAFRAKRESPRTSLGVLFAAAQLPDLLWPIFLILGWEKIAPGDKGFASISFTYYLWSHSMLLVLGWGILAAIFYYAVTRVLRGTLFVFLLAASHWLLDNVTHRPDLPLYPGGPLDVVGRMVLIGWLMPLWVGRVDAHRRIVNGTDSRQDDKRRGQIPSQIET